MLSRIDRYFAPAPDPVRTDWLGRWTYAHRGLHGGGRVENSRGAFRAAIEAGLGIECDIQRSADDVPMVFHDWDFARLIGRPDKAAALTAVEWRRLSYLESEEPPIALSDLLETVAGAVPLLIEIKSRRGYDVERSCEAVAEALADYDGLHAVMSFDPRVSRWFRKHSPATVQGLVMREDEVGYTQKAWQRRAALWAAQPEFLAYHVEALPNAIVAGLRDNGLPVLSWTVNSPEALQTARLHADAPVAEGAGLP
ncbi:glycerophosphodiester phosphodiesterase family protein [Erythrobacter litoralis]|uniref:glycerophosphodiester phosphodiesterase family protein n=1 Tax=Erythrobacter litoralis TaxID=39960 RepID=UPI0024348581|nr:glycerophosphodiester phosphodiesterase family protein [Erythrobacter litoralis]